MKKDLLDRIDVKTPCNESWDEMTGNADVRFCSHCSKDVYDLSAITRAKAEKLIHDSNGRICVRYLKDARGKVITVPPKLTQIKRQATVAAGVLAASLSFSALAYAQGSPIPAQPAGVRSGQLDRKNQTRMGLVSISGIVVDPAGAVISGAELLLKNKKGELKDNDRTNADGTFKFSYVEPGYYDIEINSPGFKKLIVTGLHVVEDIKIEKPIILEVSDVSVELLGVSGISNESEINLNETPQLITEIQQQPIIPLPRVKNLPVIGLFPGFSPEPERKSGKAINNKRKKNKNKLRK